MSPLDRRQFIQNVTAASFVGLAAGADGADSEDKLVAPFRTLYSNDTTHVLSCQRPDSRGDVTDDLLRRSIAEAAGADAHFLQPGLGWIPWWNSKIYSMEEHFRWLRDSFGIKGVHKIDRYVLKGGDLLQTLVETCHDMRVAPFLSYRLNDGHHVRQLQRALARGKPTPNMSRHYWENYERFRIGPNETEWDDGVFDWSIAEVQDHKFALIEEALANYDLTGLELDFLRHWVRFGPKTKIEKRREITTDFVRRIRKMLDKTARDRGLPRRWLCVRIPAKANVRGEQGVDLPALAGAGVDMVNLSYSYFTMQDDSVRRAKAEINNDRVAVYAEMSHCTMTGKATAGSGTQPFLRTTDEQFYTTARLARKQGARGVSLFNFPYYRYHVTDTIGPFHEPPFHVIPRLGDDDFLTAQSHWYFLTAGRKDRVIAGHPLPTIVERSDPFVVTIEMLPTPKHRKNGLLRLRSDEDIRDREIEVNFNDVSLREIEFIEKPLPHRYDNTWLGKSEQTRCFRLPAGIARDGANQIKINVNKGIRVRLRYLDITLS